MVTSANDAEYGRGSGQVQMVTRAGGNKFNGSVYWEVRNGDFNANTFFNNAAGRNPDGSLVDQRSQLKQNNYGIRFGGPVKKNKMFFNGIYEPYKQRNFTTVRSGGLHGERFGWQLPLYPGVINGNLNSAVPTVDFGGNPVQPSSATGPLQTVSVLGRDPARLTVDPTGIMSHVLSYMPLPNNFRVGGWAEYLAGYNWTQPTPVNFEPYEGRIDYNLDEKESPCLHDSSQQLVSQLQRGLAAGVSNRARQFGSHRDDHLLGRADQRSAPQHHQRSPRGHFPIRAPSSQAQYDPDNAGSKGLLPTINGVQTQIYPNALGSPVSGPYGNLSIPGNFLDPTYQYGDNITWIRGKHSLKAGFQYRFISLAGVLTSARRQPARDYSWRAALVAHHQHQLRLQPNRRHRAERHRRLVASGSSHRLDGRELRNPTISPGGKNPQFLPGQEPYHSWHQNELDWFVKDDWKITPSLTLNLGVRQEIYPAPTEQQGKGLAPVGNGAGAFGISGSTMASLFNPFATGGTPTVIQAIGPGHTESGA